MEEKLGGTAVLGNLGSEFLLEYYLMSDNNQNYGVKIEKKEKYAGNMVLREDYTSKYTIDSEDKANSVLELLLKNKVTPITAGNVLHDLGYFED